MKVSIIVPVYNEEKYLEKCLVSLFDQTYENTEIIVIDDQSTDKSPQIAKSFDVQYVRLEKKGYEAGARQKGLDLAKGEIILQTDADAIYPKEFIELMVNRLLFSSGIGIEQGYIIPLNTNSLAGKYAKYRREASFQLKLEQKKKPYGGNMYFSFARQYARYKDMLCGTDVDFVNQLKAKNYAFEICMDAFFYHNDPATLIDLFKRFYFYYSTYGKKQPLQYKFKRLIAVLFWQFLFLTWERPKQYEIAIKNKDIHGVVSIFIGNAIMDISSIGVFW